jgi:hypothetical protein
MFVMNVTIVAGDDGHQSPVSSCFLKMRQPNGCPIDSREKIDATVQTAGVWNETPGVRPFFLSPVETKPSDVEPLTPKYKELSVHTFVYRPLMPNAATVIVGAAVPLYLSHQSLLC